MKYRIGLVNNFYEYREDFNMNKNGLERVSFWYGKGFIGSHYYMKIDEGNDMALGMDEGKARELASNVLEEIWGIEIEKEDIVWQWDGTL